MEGLHKEKVIGLILVDHGMHGQRALNKTGIHTIEQTGDHVGRIHRNRLRDIHRELHNGVPRTGDDGPVVHPSVRHSTCNVSHGIGSSSQVLIVENSSLCQISFDILFPSRVIIEVIGGIDVVQHFPHGIEIFCILNRIGNLWHGRNVTPFHGFSLAYYILVLSFCLGTKKK